MELTNQKSPKSFPPQKPIITIKKILVKFSSPSSSSSSSGFDSTRENREGGKGDKKVRYLKEKAREVRSSSFGINQSLLST